jgi:hypothetical protein
MIQFSTRQLLLYVTALSLWFGVLAQAHYFFGTDGMFSSGILFGIAIVLAVILIQKWSKWSAAERCMFVFALLFSFVGAVFVAATFCSTKVYTLGLPH